MQAKSRKKKVQKTWNHRFETKRYPKRVTLDADFAGIPAGSTLFVGTPQILQTYIRKIPVGETRTMQRLRRDIAGCAIAKKLRATDAWLRTQRETEVRA